MFDGTYVKQSCSSDKKIFFKKITEELIIAVVLLI